jgi:hypothetical protein
MRTFVASLLCLLGTSCAGLAPATASPAVGPDRAEITYFDRNADLRVDYEVHDFGCCDGNWALVDSDFDGRYDTKLRWSFSFMQQPVDQPVAAGVRVSPGMPKSSY